VNTIQRVARKAIIAGQSHGFQPELRLGAATLNMDVRGFIAAIRRVEEEPKSLYAQHRRHTLNPSSNWYRCKGRAVVAT
jgi:hypothetical protein